MICDTSFGLLSAMALDPIEKKPLRQFHPHSKIFSIGTYGCNMTCPFCQNEAISMHPVTPQAKRYTPVQVIDIALSLKEYGNIGIAYTYNEPLVHFDFVLACAKLARRYGLYNVIVSNGMIDASYLAQLLPYIDAFNIDLKSFQAHTYASFGGNLDVVKENIQQIHGRAHLELTHLSIPTINDSFEEMEMMSTWIASLDAHIPLHISRFFPCYKFSHHPCSEISHIQALCTCARKHLHFVYPGNL